MTRTARSLALAAAACLAPTLHTVLAPSAHAQVRVSSSAQAGPNSTEITRKTIERITEILKLDDTQKEAVKSLHEGYLDQSRQIAEAQQAAMKPLHEEADDGDFSEMMKKMPEIMREFEGKRVKAEESFLADLRSTLTPDQDARWSRVERLRRREGMSREFSFVSGSNVDLTDLLRSVKLSETDREKVADAVDQYEVELDRLVIEQAKAEAEAQKELGDNPMNMDFAKIQEQMKAARERAVKLRDLNRAHQRKIAASLPTESATEFNEHFKKKSFRQIYRESHPTRSIAAALKFDDLTDQQRTELKAIQESYDRELAAANETWREELDKAESEGKVVGPFGLAFGADQQEGEALAAARKARKDLDKKTQQKITAALTEKQREKLPKKRNNSFMADLGDGEAAGAMLFAEDIIEGSEDGDGDTAVQRAVIIQKGP